MLDQNTDRMWYVIGAVIIGAAIILIMNKTFPQLFASVGETFKGKTEQTTEVVDGIMPKTRLETTILPSDLELYDAKKVAYDAETDTWTLNVETTPDWYWWGSGFMLKDQAVVIPYGSTFTLSYDVYIPEGMTDVYTEDDVNNYSADSAIPSWNGNDHDYVSIRMYSLNGNVVPDAEKRRPLVDGQWNEVKVIYNNVNPKNVTKSPIYDKSRFGVNNKTGGPIQFQMRDIRWGLSEYKGG